MPVIHIPTPHELGLPAKFDRFRPSQVEALRWLLTSTKRVKGLAMPTGSGKSLVYVAWALITRLATVFVTDSRALQDQLMADFEPIGMVDIRGRRNYHCEMREDYTCEEGYRAGCPMKGSLQCPSSVAEFKAAASPLVCTNYDKWTSAKKYGTGMQHFQQVVFDEGHESPNALGRAMQVVLHHRERDTHICMDPPVDPEDMVAWKHWALGARAVVEHEQARAESRIRGVPNPPTAHVRHALHMRNLNRRLGVLTTANAQHWVVEEVEKGFQFDPVRPGRYAESSLLLRVPSVLVVSATLRPKTLYMIGQGADTFDFREFDSEFPPQRNPIYWYPTMFVDSKLDPMTQQPKDMSMLWLRLAQIVGKRKDRKGIVHTISYARRDEILSRVRFGGEVFLNERGEAPTHVIEAFKRAGPGAVLVSPSVGQGHDFPGSTCEWQFICKVPFPPPSKILKARTADDKEYPHYLAMQRLVQICGRGMRSREDQCENFICDNHIEWFINRYRHLAPRSFQMFFRSVSALPQPPLPLSRG